MTEGEGGLARSCNQDHGGIVHSATIVGLIDECPAFVFRCFRAHRHEGVQNLLVAQHFVQAVAKQNNFIFKLNFYCRNICFDCGIDSNAFGELMPERMTGRR